MTAPRDDELQAMLESRADRMPVAASREVLASVLEEIRGPRGGAAFSVLPVVRTRGLSGPAGWAAIGLVAVLVLAVIGGRLGTGPAQPSSRGASGGVPATTAPSAPSAAAAATSGAATQPPAAPVIPTVTMDQLRGGLADGTLDGWTVLVTGRLQLQALPCPSPPGDECFGLQLVGLDGVEVTHGGVMTVGEASRRIPGDATDRPMAFRATGDQLAFLGWIREGADTPLTVSDLLQDGVAPGAAEVAVVAGWLIGGQFSTASCADSGASPCPRDTRPVLADAQPRADGQPTSGDAIEVTVDDSLGLAPAPATIAGPFLVRHAVPCLTCRGARVPPWRVVARLDPATTVQVGDSAASPVLTPDALKTAIADGSMDGLLVAATGSLEPSGAPCPADVPQPCVRFAILGLDGVTVTWDGALRMVGRHGPGATPAPSTIGTLLLSPRAGRLLLLGGFRGDLAHPGSVDELRSTLGGVLLQRDPLALAAVSGWLVVDGLHSCPMLGPGATPCPGPPPTLTDAMPLPDGTLRSDVQAQVQVWPYAVGIDPAAVVTAGPFLYRTVVGAACRPSDTACAGGPNPALEVVAHYDPGSIFLLTFP